MSTKSLSQFRALVFDVYGTLVDWETGIYNQLRPLIARAPGSSSWGKSETLTAFSSVEKDVVMQHPTTPYNELLALAYKTFATRLEVETEPEEETSFGLGIAAWKPYPDTVEALATLKKYYKLVVLSNVDNHSFNTFTRPLLEPHGEGTIFDLVMTAQDIGSYKPDPQNFKAALAAIQTKLGVEPGEVLVTAHGLDSDHEPANALGLSSAFIVREGSVIGIESTSSVATYDFRFPTLGDMAEEREKSG